MKQLRVTVHLHNNQMAERREALGLSQGECARLCGITLSSYNALEALRLSAFTLVRPRPERCLADHCDVGPGIHFFCKDHRDAADSETRIAAWRSAQDIVLRDCAARIANFFEVAPSDLWSAGLLKLTGRRLVRRVDVAELQTLAIDSASAEPFLALPEGGLSEEVAEGLEQAVATLSERERVVIRRRFGMDTGVPATLVEIAEEQKCSNERIRQIEAKALRKLRHPSRSKLFTEQDA